MTTIDKDLLDAVGRELVRLRLNWMYDDAEIAAMYPDAWRRICAQVEDACEGSGATLVFSRACVYGRKLEATYTTDQVVPPGYPNEIAFIVEIARAH